MNERTNQDQDDTEQQWIALSESLTRHQKRCYQRKANTEAALDDKRNIRKMEKREKVKILYAERYNQLQK